MSDPIQTGAIFRWRPLGSSIGTVASAAENAHISDGSSSGRGPIFAFESENRPNALTSANNPFARPPVRSLTLKQSFDRIYRATPLPPNLDKEIFRPMGPQQHLFAAPVGYPMPFSAVGAYSSMNASSNLSGQSMASAPPVSKQSSMAAQWVVAGPSMPSEVSLPRLPAHLQSSTSTFPNAASSNSMPAVPIAIIAEPISSPPNQFLREGQSTRSTLDSSSQQRRRLSPSDSPRSPSFPNNRSQGSDHRQTTAPVTKSARHSMLDSESDEDDSVVQLAVHEEQAPAQDDFDATHASLDWDEEEASPAPEESEVLDTAAPQSNAQPLPLSQSSVVSSSLAHSFSQQSSTSQRGTGRGRGVATDSLFALFSNAEVPVVNQSRVDDPSSHRRSINMNLDASFRSVGSPAREHSSPIVRRRGDQVLSSSLLLSSAQSSAHKPMSPSKPSLSRSPQKSNHDLSLDSSSSSVSISPSAEDTDTREVMRNSSVEVRKKRGRPRKANGESAIARDGNTKKRQSNKSRRMASHDLLRNEHVQSDLESHTRSGRVSKPVHRIAHEMQDSTDRQSYSSEAVEVVAAMRAKASARRQNSEAEKEQDEDSQSEPQAQRVLSADKSKRLSTGSAQSLSLSTISRRLIAHADQDTSNNEDSDRERNAVHKRKKKTTRPADSASERSTKSVARQREWKPKEMVALYAAHSKIDVTKPNFWELVSQKLREDNVFRSKEECEQRWFVKLIERQKQREKLQVQKEAQRVDSAMDRLQELGKQRQPDAVPAFKRANTKRVDKDNEDADSDVDVDKTESNELQPAAKKIRMGKNDLKVWAEQSSKADKNDDLFNADLPTLPFSQRSQRGSASGAAGGLTSFLAMSSLPDLSSPAARSHHTAASSADRSDRATVSEDSQLFTSNRVQKIRNRIQPQLVSGLPTASAEASRMDSLASMTRTMPFAETQHASIDQLRKKIGKAVDEIKRNRKRAQGVESEGESLGDEDTESGEEEEEEENEDLALY